MGDQSYDACRALGVALAKLVAGTNTLIVASSDLSHYHTYDEAVREDHKTLKAIGEYDYFDLSRNLDLRVWEACGGGPIVATMIAAERLGANQANVLHYANTGDVTGDHSRVVGYGAVALVKAAGAVKTDEAPFSLTSAEKDALLKIARKSVETAVRDGKTYECSTGGLEALAQERGAFVTLTKNGELRGCIGSVAPVKPLYLTVREVAMMAALRDNRFLPVTASELARPAIRDLCFVPVAARDGRPGDPRRAAWLADPRARPRGLVAAAGRERREMGSGHVPAGGLSQGRPPGACVAGCRRRTLPFYRAGVRREQAGCGARSAGSVCGIH